MRLKKLKIAVGIALVLFVLVVANTLIFGLIQKEMAAIPGRDSDKITVSLAEKNETSTNNSANTTASNRPAEQTAPTPPVNPSVATPVPATRAS